jgi:hypothetical protein
MTSTMRFFNGGFNGLLSRKVEVGKTLLFDDSLAGLSAPSYRMLSFKSF